MSMSIKKCLKGETSQISSLGNLSFHHCWADVWGFKFHPYIKSCLNDKAGQSVTSWKSSCCDVSPGCKRKLFFRLLLCLLYFCKRSYETLLQASSNKAIPCSCSTNEAKSSEQGARRKRGFAASRFGPHSPHHLHLHQNYHHSHHLHHHC